jgi:hypothetical protein
MEMRSIFTRPPAVIPLLYIGSSLYDSDWWAYLTTFRRYTALQSQKMTVRQESSGYELNKARAIPSTVAESLMSLAATDAGGGVGGGSLGSNACDCASAPAASVIIEWSAVSQCGVQPATVIIKTLRRGG